MHYRICASGDAGGDEGQRKRARSDDGGGLPPSKVIDAEIGGGAAATVIRVIQLKLFPVPVRYG